MRKSKMTYVSHAIFLLDRVGVEKGQMAIKESPSQHDSTLTRNVVGQMRARTGGCSRDRDRVRVRKGSGSDAREKLWGRRRQSNSRRRRSSCKNTMVAASMTHLSHRQQAGMAGKELVSILKVEGSHWGDFKQWGWHDLTCILKSSLCLCCFIFSSKRSQGLWNQTAGSKSDVCHLPTPWSWATNLNTQFLHL